ncbi:MAG TPA: M15 family metallopeptidase [Candidatus Paceibacterota bacterium]|nr:M15 family metallopeptidase [Candidatus Paceibacterota bacterium]
MANMKILWAVVGISIVLFALGAFFYVRTTTALTQKLDTATNELSETAASLAEAERQNEELTAALNAERERNDAFANQIDEITGTVGRLDKLSRTDPELLQKYSRVYFLNENYAPADLYPVPQNYWFQEGKDEEILTGIAPHLIDLLEAATEDGIDLLVASSYRSFERQGELKNSYVVRYGTGANAFSAEQGYSEHQLGTTVDFTTREVGGTFAGFDQTEAYEWLAENAYKYGFVLSYPKGNTYYQYEPWHWRFVGRELARDLHRDEKFFYDLDQREIDTYLVNFYD